MFRKDCTKKSLAKRAAAAVLCALMCVGILAAAPEKAAACDTPVGYEVYYASVDSGYLALRNAKAFDYTNEIGAIYNGQAVYVTEKSWETYWYVYVPSLDKWGYTNSKYLRKGETVNHSAYSSNTSSCNTYTVKVQSGYLALRTAMAYDNSNEIGALYTGEIVEFCSVGDSTYWYVYAPSLGKWGYVNKNYLAANGYSGSAYTEKWIYTAKVKSGYLALRNAKAFDYNNEIGAIYTGEQVQVINKESGDYWYVYVPTLGKYGYTNKNYLF